MARLALALAAALLGVAGVRAAEEPTYTACKTANDCVSSDNADLGQTSCAIYSQYSWTDTSGTNPVNHNVQFGICVQCSSDCDCGVNEYCAVGPSVTTKWWSDTDVTQAGNAWTQAAMEQLSAYQGGNYKMKGKCLEYGASDAESERIGAPCNENLQMSSSSSNDPDHADWKMTCGYVSDWQPEYRECNSITNQDGSAGTVCSTGDDRPKNPGWNTPGTCTARVNNGNAGNAPQCTGAGTWWAGVCKNKECQICRDGDTRCTGTDGISQTCIGGKWVPSIFFDNTARTAAGSVIVQALAAMVAFMSVILLIGCFSCLATARAAKNMAAAAKQ